ITVLASNFSAAFFSAASALARSAPSISMSNTLPWRTLATPLTPSVFRAPSIALPCGSKMPDFKVTVTRAFIALSIWMNRRDRNQAAALVHRLSRLLEKPPIARHTAAFTHQPHGRPKRCRGRRHHGNTVTSLERLRHPEGAQAAARD